MPRVDILERGGAIRFAIARSRNDPEQLIDPRETSPRPECPHDGNSQPVTSDGTACCVEGKGLAAGNGTFRPRSSVGGVNPQGEPIVNTAPLALSRLEVARILRERHNPTPIRTTGGERRA